MMYHVIMCGGIGSRFWPMSTKNTPKQFIKLVKIRGRKIQTLYLMNNSNE